MYETGRIQLHFSTVSVIRVRQYLCIGLVRYHQIGHDLLAAPLVPFVADKFLYLR